MQVQFQRPAAWQFLEFSRQRAAAIAIVTAEIMLLALVAWALVRLFWVAVTPVTPLGDWRPASQAPARVDRSVLGSFDPFFGGAVADDAAVSSLALVLSGTRVDTVSGRGSAIIATADGVQASFTVGDTIEPGVTLQSVGFDSVTIARGGSIEKLFIDQSAGGAPVTPPAAGTNLAADVNVVPRLQGTTLTGYVLTPKGSGAAFAAAGLQPGDVLVSVDGATVTSLKDAAGLTQQLESGGIDITVERAGRPVTLRIGGK